MGLAATATIAAGAFALTSGIRRRLSSNLGKFQLRFYEGKWGERFVKLAGLHVEKRAAVESLAQLTEVALGRATDALYDALPKQVRQELAQLPDVVRRLEHNARGLRAELEKLDESLITLDADAAGAMPSTVIGSDQEAAVRTERDRLRSDLRQTRDRAATRLAETVAALENIRLDLLRLQLGEGRVDSVTASLQAAEQAGADLGAYADAAEEVERALRPPPRLIPRTSNP
jgi:hypothetical protein